MKIYKVKKLLLLGLFFVVVPSLADDIFTNEFEQNIALRISQFEIVDPHMFTLVIGAVCFDITSQINAEMQSSMENDANGDGFLDSSAMTQFSTDQPSYLTSRELNTRFIGGLCPDPLHSDACQESTIQNENVITMTSESNDCLAPTMGTTSGYTPAPNTTSFPCYTTEPIDSVINIAGIDVTVSDFQSATRYHGGLLTDQGLNKGFISEADAENIVFPMSVPVIGGLTLASILPGGTGNCALSDDRDLYTDNVTSGWWLYVNTESEIVELQ